MDRSSSGGDVADGQLVDAADMIAALTAAEFVFDDGATQSFTAAGQTTYVDQGVPSTGDWSVVGDGTFASFWPPTYRATYTVRWLIEDGARVGVSFTDTRSGARYAGRYRPGAS
jgi:hypothetical protein